MPIPNFFIVGAAKSGTTALSEYLRLHPNVFMSSPKEPAYFCKDLAGDGRISALEKYLSLFKRAKKHHLAIGEASTAYLLSDVAAAEIMAFQPAARIIVMVRNPVDMMPSLHNQRVFEAAQHIEDFETAWRAQLDREQKNERETALPEIDSIPYRQWGNIGSQLKNWLEVVPKEKIQVILFDDFAKNPKAIYREVLDFLSLPDDHRTEFPRMNPSKTRRSRLAQSFARNPPVFLQKVASFVGSVLGVETLGLMRFLTRINARAEPQSPLSEAMRQELIETFRDEVLLLSELIDRDLSHWLTNTRGRSSTKT